MTVNPSTPNPAISPGGKREATSERANLESIARMQRGILRLALAYHGVSSELDRKLKEFGTLVRSGRRQQERQALIDEIVDTIVALDLKRPVAQDTEPHSDTQTLVKFLDELAVPATLKPEIERTQRALASARDQAEILEYVQQAARILSANLLQSPESCGDANAIRMLLVELLERIPITPKLVNEVSPIRRAVEKADQVNEFISCIDSVGDLVGALRAEMQAEIDRLSQYLKAVAERLGEFENFVNRSRDVHLETAADALQLSAAVEDEMRILRADADAADTVEAMRAAIESHLDNIGNGLHAYIELQNSRTNDAKQALARVTEKMRDLEDQTESLRENLERQHAQVLMDPLTGVLNRAGYIDAGNKQFARWKRYGGKLSLAVIDLDLFKQINDEYGHAAGDRVLSTVATQLKEMLRESDILCRYGGEEFVLLLPETEGEQAYLLLDKLRSHIEECPFRYKETPVKITLSCGIAQFRDGDTLASAFERADQAMYVAKAGGRNRTCLEADNIAVARTAAR